MPKLKTHKGAAKRFKKTATGKVKRSNAFSAPHLTSKDKKRKSRLRGCDTGQRCRHAESEENDSVLGIRF